MQEFSDERADAAFLRVAQAVAKVRSDYPDFTNEEIAYALLQACTCIDDSEEWGDFLCNALADCIWCERGEDGIYFNRVSGDRDG